MSVGRTHQIRSHLQYLGYPIINDPIYNNPAWGDDRYKHGPCHKDVNQVVDEMTASYQSFMKDSNPQPAKGNVADHDPYFSPDCPECKNPLPDPTPESLIMYLHARKYTFENHEFETPMPPWASHDNEN